MEEFIIPETVTEIADGAFQRNSLKSISIHDGVITIGKGAFEYCYNESIRIGSGVQKIGEDFLNGCYYLETIEVDKDNKHFQSIDGILYNKAKTELIASPYIIKAPSLPRELRVIASHAFWGRQIEKLIIPEGVTTIGDGALGNSRIKEIYFPRSLKNFGELVAFEGYFKKMYVPKGFGNQLIKQLSISMQYGDYDLEEYDDLPVEWDEARKKNLQRFVNAQDSGGIYDGTGTYAEALQEVKNGHKRGHWIWYVFPQMKGLGKSEISQFYGINGREEAKAYIENPILRERLIEISEAVLNNENSVYDIFGQDAIKVRACILLFASVCDIPVFKQLKSKYRW